MLDPNRMTDVRNILRSDLIKYCPHTSTTFSQTNTCSEAQRDNVPNIYIYTHSRPDTTYYQFFIKAVGLIFANLFFQKGTFIYRMRHNKLTEEIGRMNIQYMTVKFLKERDPLILFFGDIQLHLYF